MARKAEIYKEKDFVVNRELVEQLRAAVDALEDGMRAVVPISRGGAPFGFGVDKAQKNIAADAVISIARAIKVIRGW